MHLDKVDLMNLAPRCGARTRKGGSCCCPAVKGRRRCRLHGARSAAPRGEANGAFVNGAWTVEAVELRREVSRLLKAIRNGGGDAGVTIRAA